MASRQREDITFAPTGWCAKYQVGPVGDSKPAVAGARSRCSQLAVGHGEEGGGREHGDILIRHAGLALAIISTIPHTTQTVILVGSGENCRELAGRRSDRGRADTVETSSHGHSAILSDRSVWRSALLRTPAPERNGQSWDDRRATLQGHGIA